MVSVSWILLTAAKHAQFICDEIEYAPSDACFYQCARSDTCVGAYEWEGDCGLLSKPFPYYMNFALRYAAICWYSSRVEDLTSNSGKVVHDSLQETLLML